MLGEGADICYLDRMLELDDPPWSAFNHISKLLSVPLHLFQRLSPINVWPTPTHHRGILQEPRILLVLWLHLEPRD